MRIIEASDFTLKYIGFTNEEYLLPFLAGE